jgi:NNP family nitrate/nitrite transporter-like MFS transporter
VNDSSTAVPAADGRATRIQLFSLKTAPMRAFHAAWLAFFLCFFAWFGIAPLMPVIRAELGLTQSQIGNVIIASVATTIIGRLAIGWLCDRIGPRYAFSALLIGGSLPVMAIGLADSYETFLLFRLGIGVIGASFVVTQYHTTLMFAPSVVGTANATTAGWGNLGGGVTQFAMPLLFSALVGAGLASGAAWRVAMVIAGAVCLVVGILYPRLTQDTPEGNLRELRAAGRVPPRASKKGTFGAAVRDRRVWALFVLYGACFGLELTIHNIGALYFVDYYGMSLAAAGVVTSLFGCMSLFARTIGGVVGDRLGATSGLRGRVVWLFAVILAEGVFLLLFAKAGSLPVAVIAMMLFGVCVQMGAGATFSVVPFVNPRALGSVAGVVGAGGNAGAVAAGFLFKGALPWDDALLVLGVAVTLASFAALTIQLSDAPAKDVAPAGLPVGDEAVA